MLFHLLRFSIVFFFKDSGRASSAASFGASLSSTSIVVPQVTSVGTVRHAHSEADAHITTTTLRSCLPTSNATIFGSVVHPLSRLRALGYLTPVLNQLSRSRLASSNATYESSLRDPFFASPALVADFLVHVATTRRASYSTLTCYRTATCHVLRLVTDFDPILPQLMQSFKRSQPVTAKRIPVWDFRSSCQFFVDRTV